MTDTTKEVKYIGAAKGFIEAYEQGAKDEQEKIVDHLGIKVKEAYEKGKQAGRDEAVKAGCTWCEDSEKKIAALEERLITEKQAGRDEENKNWVETKAFLDNGKDEKIAALEERLKIERQAERDEAKEEAISSEWGLFSKSLRMKNKEIAALETKVEIMKTKECPTCKRTRGTTAERLKCYCCLDEENARLRETLEKIKGKDGNLWELFDITEKRLDAVLAFCAEETKGGVNVRDLIAKARENWGDYGQECAELFAKLYPEKFKVI